jgi:hypothetical protein
MSENKPCIACAEPILVSAKLCKHCKIVQNDDRFTENNSNKVLIPFKHRRVLYASVDSSLIKEEDMQDVWVEPDSEEAKLASSRPFSGDLPPRDGDLVPRDCVWAYARHPGYGFPGLIESSSMKTFFTTAGLLKGRRLIEIEDYVGPPNLAMADSVGWPTLSWSHNGFFSTFQVALKFDPYYVCVGVLDQLST